LGSSNEGRAGTTVEIGGYETLDEMPERYKPVDTKWVLHEK
jgi:hypothetical protein